jgi:hypothetical protein
MNWTWDLSTKPKLYKSAEHVCLLLSIIVFYVFCGFVGVREKIKTKSWVHGMGIEPEIPDPTRHKKNH